MIRHLVLMTFHDAADAPEAQRRLEQLETAVPDLLTMEVGLDVTGSPTASHLGLVSTHADLDGLAAYVEHPAHQEFLAWVRPRLASRAVVDSAHG